MEVYHGALFILKRIPLSLFPFLATLQANFIPRAKKQLSGASSAFECNEGSRAHSPNSSCGSFPPPWGRDTTGATVLGSSGAL